MVHQMKNDAGVPNSTYILPALEFYISKIPSHFKEDLICPLIREFFKDPVVTSNGNTYERDSITLWLVTSKKSSLTMKVLDNNILNRNTTVQQILTTPAARKPEEFEKTNTQEIINIDIEPETILEGYVLRHEPNDLSTGHALWHEPDVLSLEHVLKQNLIREDTLNIISLNGISEFFPEGHASRQEPRRSKT